MAIIERRLDCCGQWTEGELSVSVSRYRRAHRHTLPLLASILIPEIPYQPCQLSVKDCTLSGADQFDLGGIFYHTCDKVLGDLEMGSLLMILGFLPGL